MKKYNSIGKLIERMLSGEMTGEAQEKLIEVMKNSIPVGGLDTFYEEQWLAAPENGKMPGSDKILKQIHRRLAINQESRSVKIVFMEILKYAAIVILAFTAGVAVNRFIDRPSDAKSASAPLMCDISVEYGSKTKITLPDGTKVKLNSGSKLIYPSEFEDKMRIVTLEGEAFFDVAKETSRPFFVNTHPISVKVLGTSFNVKSYKEENYIETTVESGSIEIYNELASIHPDMTKPPVAVLKKSDKAIFVKDMSTITVNSGLKPSENLPSLEKKAGIMVESQIETGLYTAWKDNVLRFKAEKFEDIAVKLERWYGVNIEIRNKTLKEEYFTGQFDTETIEQALEALKLTAPFRYTITKNEIVIN